MDTIISILIGGLITWFFAWYYYKRAGDELLIEATELRRLNNLMLHGMEHAGWIKLNRDNLGRILGFEQIIEPNSIKSEEKFGMPTIKTSPTSSQRSKLASINGEEVLGDTKEGNKQD